MESAYYAGCQNKLDCTTLSSFKAIFEGPSLQTDATLSNPFQKSGI